jgi:hypothetical protein
MAYTLNGINLGDIQKEHPDLSSSLDVETYPMSGSKDVEAIDEGNVVREITLEGVYSDTSQANIMNNFVQPIDALQNGNQAVVVFHSDLWDLTTAGDYTSGNFNVKVKRFSWDYIKGENLKVAYTLVIVESI